MYTRKILIRLLLGVMVIAIGVPATAATYKVDKNHSSISFSVRHMAISNVKGTFDDFEASFDFETGKASSWSCEAVIQTASVNTGNKKRDEHLLNTDFFDAEQFPTIKFKSTSVKMDDDGEGTLKGNLTLHGVTKEVELELELVGVLEKSPFGDSRAGFTATGKIDRKEFGLSWNKAMETGGLMVGNDVKITIEVEGVIP